jgi:hypothetical protein
MGVGGSEIKISGRKKVTLSYSDSISERRFLKLMSNKGRLPPIESSGIMTLEENKSPLLLLYHIHKNGI